MSDATASSFRLSPQQERQWALEPDGPRGRVQCTVVFPGDTDPERLRAALARVVERHEILRTTFQRHPGIRTPLQAVHAQLVPAWRSVDLDESGDLTHLAAEEAAAELDLEHGPLVRAAYASVHDAGSALVLTVSALCSDGAGTTVLADDLLAVYEGSERRDPLQYADYAQWQNELLAADDDAAQEAHAYWQTLAAAPIAPASISFADPSAPATAPVSVDLQLADEAAALLADSRKAVPSLLAALAVIGKRFSGEDEIDVNLLDDGRHLDDLADAVGAFARLIPFRVDFTEQGTFASVVDAIDTALESGLRWRDQAPDITSRPGAASLPLVLEWVDLSSTAVASSRRSSTPERSLATLVGSAEGLSLQYEPSVLAPDDAERIAAGVASVLAAVAQDTGAAVDSLPLAGAAELERVLEASAGPPAAPAAGTIHAAFREQVTTTPEHVAVSDESGSLTYDELNRAANRVADWLRSHGVGQGTVVGLCTDRSTDAIVGLLGILKAGGAYLPLHSEHPPSRLAQLLAQTEAPVVITQEPLLDSLDAFSGAILCLDRDRAELDAQSDADPDELATADDVVYVIYTSGSTGEPKGVAVTHANLRAYTAFMVSRLDAESRPLRFALVSALSTDLGNTVVFPALLSGGELRLISPQVAMDGVALAEAGAEPYDVLKITPSHLSALLVGGGAAILPREWLVLGGEACPWELVERVGELGSCRVINHYGPTETTVGCSTFDLSEDVSRWRPATAPIGRAIAGAACYVLDGARGAVPTGVPGELYVAGAGVARGYVARPDETEARFVELDRIGGVRAYATGDRVRLLPNGAIEFLGRADDQVKIRGYRVEPGEVAAAIQHLPGVVEAAVVAREDAPGERRLVAYVVGEPPADLRRTLADTLPEYMIPSAFVELDALPRTPSGKIDRRALPEPLDQRADATYRAPRDETEEAIAEIWQRVLGLDRVGIDDDFFDLGGHSLLATQVIAQVQSTCGVLVPLNVLFVGPTVAQLAAQVEQARAQSPAGASSGDEMERLLADLEQLSDEEAERLLASERQSREEA